MMQKLGRAVPIAALWTSLACAAVALHPSASAQDLLMLPGPAPAEAAQPVPAAETPVQPAAVRPESTIPASTQPASAPMQPAARAMSLEQVSLFAVVPPEPKQHRKHDLIEIIINESSVQQFEQSLDTKKDYQTQAILRDFLSIRNLLEAQLKTGDSPAQPLLDVGAKNDFKGEGEFERKDKFTARVTATVLDVKPNGTLVLEARETIQSDEETSILVLSGVARREDITGSNTIQSSQLADLVLKTEHEGQVKDSSEKGLIPRILETLFNF